MFKKLPAPPLWLFGLLEAVQAVLATALLVAVPVFIGLAVRSFIEFELAAATGLAGQVWLVIHATPLEIAQDDAGGLFHLVPLALTLIPFALAWRAGRRLAQGAYPDQLWQGVVAFAAGYALAAAAIAGSTETPLAHAPVWWAVLTAGAISTVGALAGCYAEARSATRMLGVDLEEKLEGLSQQVKWAGAYLWAVTRAGAVAAVAAVGLAAVLLAGTLAWRWMDVANAYQQLDAGIGGAAGITVVQLGLAPNLLLWTLAYATGAGFSVGAGTTVSPLGTELGSMPAIPVLAAVPDQIYEYSWATLGLPLLAGLLAGWWLMREGENHFDDWCQLKLRVRAASLAVSTTVLGLLTGLVAAALLIGPLWLSHISLGVGRMVDIGPHAALAAALLGAWVAAGTILGYLCAPVTKLSTRRRADRQDTQDDAEDEITASR